MKYRGTGRIGLGVALALASCLRASVPEFPSHLTTTLKLSERPAGPHGPAPFAVVAAGPRGEVGTDVDPGITLVFNRPMRALEPPKEGSGAADDTQTDPALPNVTLKTEQGQAVPGAFRWVGKRGLLFEPKGKLPGATRFNVRVPAGTAALDGSRLSNDYVLEFATLRPSLVNSWINDGLTQARPNAPLFLQFSQRIAPEEAARRSRLTRRVAETAKGELVPFTVSAEAPPRTKASEVPLWLKFTPNAELPKASTFDLEISPGLVGTEGPLGTEKSMGLSFQTYGPLRISNVLCARQSLGRCQAHRDFSVVTSTPVRSEDLLKFVTITGPKRPALPKAQRRDKSETPGHHYPLGLDPDYGDVFQVSISPELTDTFGQRLGTAVKVELAVEAPYVLPSGAQPKPKSDARKLRDRSADYGDQPPPDVPRRPNLFQDLEFGVRGEVLEALAGVGGADGPAQHKIPVGSVNVPTYGVRTWASSELSTMHWLGHSTPTEHWVDPPAWSWLTPGGPENQRAVQLLDLDAALGTSKRGAAFIQAMALGEGQIRSQLLSVTDLGISARISRFGSTVWVTHLSTGAPAAGANVSLYDEAGKALVSHTADAAGLVDFASNELEPLNKHNQLVGNLVLVARSGEDWTFERVRQSPAVDVGTWVDSVQKADWAGLVFADRGVYRPGEVLRAGGYFRQTQAKGFSVPKDQELEYTVRDVNGEAIAQGRGKLDRFGALSLRVELPKSAALGTAELSVRLGLGENESFSTSFQIMEFKPAEFKVGVDPVKAQVVHGSKANFVLHSEYLFGAPVADGHVDLYISRTPTHFSPPGSEGLVLNDDAFKRDLRSYYNDSSYDQTTLQLDEQGKAEFEWPLDGEQPHSPMNLMLEADVQDLTRQAQTGRDSVLIHPAEFYLGIESIKNRFLAIGAQVTPSLLALSPEGKPVSGVPVRIELMRRTWTTATEDRPADSLYYQTGVQDTPAGECAVTSAPKATGCTLRIAEPGYYIVRVSAKDKLGNAVYASSALYGVDDRADSKPVVGWKEADRRGLKLEFDKQSYLPGEVAKLLVKNPFSSASALLTVERGSILDRRVVELKGPMPVIEIPIKDDFFPNAFVSVHLLRGRTARAVSLENINQADVGAPQFRVGYTQLLVDPNSRKLDVQVTTPKKGYSPGEEVRASVQLRDVAGKPAAGSLTFYVVDEGVLMLTGYKTPEPLGAFSNARSLGVFPIESRDSLARIIALRAGERFEPRGWETPPREETEYDYGDKGYEGGDGEPGRPRSEFKTTVFFEAGRAVGDDGRAEFRFKLPDNLTSFRLMAVAAGADDRFGSSEHSITSSRPLMARPLLPRAVRVGDKFEAGVAVTSLGLPAGKAQVSFKPSGLQLQTASAVTVNLSASGQAEARFGVSVTKAGELGFEFAATHPQARDSVRVSRTATQPVRWLTAASYGATKDSVAIGLGDLRAVRADLGELNVTVSSSALVGLDSVFQNLIDYPYGCTEQLASRVLPMLAAPELAAQQNVNLPRGRIDWVDEAIGQIASRQRYDGSFGYWENDDTDVPWLSAYALLALERASQQGYFVPRNVRNGTVSYLTGKLSELVDLAKTERANAARAKDEQPDKEPSTEPIKNAARLGLREHSGKDEQLLRLAQATFIADALVSSGQPLKSQLYELASFHDEMSVSVRAQLVHAMARARLPRQDTQPLLDEVLAATTNGPFEARVETSSEVLSEIFESPARTTAWALRAVIAVDSANVIAPKLARGLVGFRQHDSYRNTQEDAWALIALEEYRQTREHQPPNFSVRVALDDELKGEFAFRGLPVHAETTKIPMADVLAADEKRVGLFAEGDGPMYYAVSMKAAKDGASSIAIDEGLSIDKRMRAVEPVELDDVAGIIPRRTNLVAGLGQLVVVDLLLESAEPRDQIVIDDPLPAGLEPVDFGFETTARALSTMNDEQARLLEKPVPQTARWGQVGQLLGVHREMRDDRVVLFLPAIDAGIYHLRYLARATTPGHFVMPPTRTSCMYDPEIYGQNAGAIYEVSRERDPAAKDAAKGPVALLSSHP